MASEEEDGSEGAGCRSHVHNRYVPRRLKGAQTANNAPKKHVRGPVVHVQARAQVHPAPLSLLCIFDPLYALRGAVASLGFVLHRGRERVFLNSKQSWLCCVCMCGGSSA